MSLRIPDPNQPSPGAGADLGQTPLTNPFAAGPGGFLTPENLEAKPNRLGGMLVLGLVITAAAGVLLGMRQMGMGPKLALAEIKIDYPLDGAALASNTDHERVLADLQAGREVKRIPLDMVQTNPFAWRSLAPAEKPKANTENPEDLTRRQEEERRAKIADAASKLTLNSLMGGRTPMARIDGQLVRVGERVGEFFTVTAIEGRTVHLECEGQTFALMMGEQEAEDGKQIGLPSKPRH